MKTKEQKLITSLKKLSKRGTGPCGGGGCLDAYSQGVREEAIEWRRLIRRVIKEYETV